MVPNGSERVVDGKQMEEVVVVLEVFSRHDLLEEHFVANIHHIDHLSLPLEAALKLDSNVAAYEAPGASFSNNKHR